jgi:hypothetical protein
VEIPEKSRDTGVVAPRHRLGPRLAPLAACLAVSVFASSLASVAAGRTVVVLPVEIVGENGTTSSVVVDVPSRRAREVRSLWMQIHGLSFADMVSVQINESAWFSLNNDTSAVAEPGKSYGGIGGSFSTRRPCPIASPYEPGRNVG